MIFYTEFYRKFFGVTAHQKILDAIHDVHDEREKVNHPNSLKSSA